MAVLYGPIIAPPLDTGKDDQVHFPNNVVFLQVGRWFKYYEFAVNLWRFNVANTKYFRSKCQILLTFFCADDMRNWNICKIVAHFVLMFDLFFLQLIVVVIAPGVVVHR